MTAPIVTPVERRGPYWVKRDDTYAVGASRGGKVRTCMALATQEGVQGLVTAGSRQSPQVNIVATIADQLGLPCRVHVPSGALTPELLEAQAAGAEVIQHAPGYNTVIVARARADALATGWTEIPFGMETPVAVQQTATQVANLPDDLQRIVIPVGSGMSLAGVLAGLDHYQRTDVPALGVVVGARPDARLDKYAPLWRFKCDLVAAGMDYHAHAPTTTLHGLDLDPVYEAKCIPHLEEGDLLWVVGCRATAAAPAP